MKRTRKWMLSSLAFFAALGAAAFTGCTEIPGLGAPDSGKDPADSGGQRHECDWGDWSVTTPATCTEDGVKTRVCKGDPSHKETDAVPATGHSWALDFTVDAPATCTADGFESKHCTVDGCDGKSEVTAIPAAHAWADDFTVDVPATCTADGSKSKHCTADGCDAKTEVTKIDKTAHNFATGDSWTVDTAATCTADGSKSHHCLNDGCDAKTDVTPIAAGDGTHVWADDFTTDKAPTCTEEGSKSRHCTKCDDKTDVTAIPATGHSFATGDNWTVDVPATCTVDGSKSHHCLNDGCDAKTDVTVITAGDGTHVWADDFTTDKAPTCTEEGSKSRHCTKCDDKTDVTAIPATGHIWADDFTTDKAPTCTEDGSKSKHCTVDGCDAKGEVTPIPAAHTLADEFTVDAPATCTEDGSESKHCTVDGCDGKGEVTVIPATGHAYADDFTTDKAPTCTEDGSKSKHCTVDGCDGKGEVTVIPATGHSLVAIAAHSTASPNTKAIKRPNNAAASAAGIAHYRCDNCEKTFTDADGENEITSTYALARAGMLLDFGANLVDATGVNTAKTGTNYCSFYIADDDGLFTFNFDDQVNIVQIICMLSGTATNTYVYSSVTNTTVTTAGWQTESDAYNKFVVPDSTAAPGNTVTAALKNGEWLIFIIDSIKYAVDVEAASLLKVGKNTVEITEAYSMFADKYKFVPAETRLYSMTVPADVEVLMNDEDFIVGVDRTVNFEATAGEIIEFAFKYTQVGSVTLTIGEAVELPKLTTETPIADFTLNAHGASVLEIGDVEEGEYTVTIVFANSVMRNQIYFGKNISEDYDDYYTSNGSTVSECPAWVNFQFPMAQVLSDGTGNCTATRTGATCNVTLTLKKGDKLVFVTSAGTAGYANISMVQVQA